MRAATRAEWGGIFRPVACVVGTRVVYFFRSFKGILCDGEKREIFKIPFGYSGGPFCFPDGTSLTLDRGVSGRVFDGCPLEERWPTPKQRILVSGRRIIRVRPEDDVLLFDFEGALPPMDLAVMAFLILSFSEDG